jgi:AbrB family looped-hinge helix DNA binding protein
MFTKIMRAMKTGDSIAVTIPAIWRQKHNIQPSDRLQVLISEDELIIRPLKEKNEGGDELVARRPPIVGPSPSLSPKKEEVSPIV